MGNYTYNYLKLVGRERPDADQVEIGVDIDGAFFALGSFKLQGFNIERAEAQQAAAEAAQTTPTPTQE